MSAFFFDFGGVLSRKSWGFFGDSSVLICVLIKSISSELGLQSPPFSSPRTRNLSGFSSFLPRSFFLTSPSNSNRNRISFASLASIYKILVSKFFSLKFEIFTSLANGFIFGVASLGSIFFKGDVSRNHLNQSFLEIMLSQERFKKGFAFLNSSKIQTLILMEGVGGDGAVAIALMAAWKDDFARVFQYYLDKSTPLPTHRWLGALVVTTIYVLRVYHLQGFYTVSFGLGIYILNLLIGFLSPKVDPELEVLDGASLPTKESDEIKPFYSPPS